MADARATAGPGRVAWLVDWRVRYLALRRVCEALAVTMGPRHPTTVVADRLVKNLGWRRSFEVPPGVAGPGLSLAHVGPVVVSRNARLGSNCRLHAGVNIGVAKGGSPRLGDDCYVGPGAKIFGGVELGDGCRIGANAVVTRSFPAGSTLVGVPAVVVAARRVVES